MVHMVRNSLKYASTKHWSQIVKEPAWSPGPHGRRHRAAVRRVRGALGRPLPGPDRGSAATTGNTS
ncbi:hypothetical protein [Streptomyces sp. TUS-ST3]|uniref:hypothetical protein n=1 Tax=Streptomyces sp. TUS-ST3 TaxID=3025591 RepID=UPI0032EA32A1